MKLHLFLFIFAKLNVIAAEALPENWQDFIAKDLIEKHQGKSFIGYSEKFFQGDIIGVDPGMTASELGGQLNNAISDEKKRWTDGVVPYSISESYATEETRLERALIMIAMDTIASSTGNCIRFVPRTSEEDYIHITRGLGCSSNVGRAGGRQIVSFTRGCLEEVGTIQHEFLHALGFYHEQTRVDRDKYILINWSNLQESAKLDFKIPTDAVTFGLPYDYDSILHYRFNAMAINNRFPTIIPKQKNKRIGQNANLSVLDILKLRKAYNCPEEAYEQSLIPAPQKTVTAEKPTIKATTVATTEITEKFETVQNSTDLGLPVFKRERWSKEECQELNSGTCKVPKWANCPTGYFGFFCNTSSTNQDIRNQLEKIKKALPVSPITLSIGMRMDLKAETLESLSDNIVVLEIAYRVAFDCDVFKTLPLPNVLELIFFESHSIRIGKDSLTSLTKLRVITFTKSSVKTIEDGAFENLVNLQAVAFDKGIILPFGSKEKSHLVNLHCSAEHAWLREYLSKHPGLLQPKGKGDVYRVPGTVNTALTRRNLFYPVDCSKEDLTGLPDQKEFSINVRN